MNTAYLNLFLLVVFLTALILLWLMYNRKSRGAGSFLANNSVLSHYSKDLSALAREKKLDPVIGREEEISRAIQILSRRTKNNPVLIGPAGVGKTSIVEGLALAIEAEKVPPSLFNKRVLALDLSNILAGTKYRGEFEERFKKITSEIVAAKRSIILFIDEIHILAEAGEAEGAINAADIMKPLLTKGDLQVVGATTNEEYDKYIKNDKTLDRRLQPIFVAEPSQAETKQILLGIKSVYEKFHEVKISLAAIDEAIKATSHLFNRSYPDKAIDAIDEACSKVRLESITGKNRKEISPADIREVVTEWHKQY